MWPLMTLEVILYLIKKNFISIMLAFIENFEVPESRSHGVFLWDIEELKFFINFGDAIKMLRNLASLLSTWRIKKSKGIAVDKYLDEGLKGKTINILSY